MKRIMRTVWALAVVVFFVDWIAVGFSIANGNYKILILKQPNPYLVPYAILNLSGNVIGFIPFGILFPHLFKKTVSFRKFVLSAALMIAAIELIQLFSLRGSCDIDDLILNMLGSIIGYPIGGFIAKVLVHKGAQT